MIRVIYTAKNAENILSFFSKNEFFISYFFKEKTFFNKEHYFLKIFTSVCVIGGLSSAITMKLLAYSII